MAVVSFAGDDMRNVAARHAAERGGGVGSK